VPIVKDSPQQRALRRSALLNASQRRLSEGPGVVGPMVVAGESKLPLGHEPDPRSSDWAHRCRVPTARLVPNRDRPVALQSLGLPRPRTLDGWPMPFTGKDPADPCVTEWGLVSRSAYVPYRENRAVMFPATTFHAIGPCEFDASIVERMRCSVSIFLDD